MSDMLREATSIRLDKMFTSQLRRAPHAVAIIHRGERTTYRALNERANQFANAKLGCGLSSRDRIAIALPRSTDLIAAMLGSMKIGCVYVPIDVALPAERIAWILQDSKAKAMLALDPNLVPAGFAGQFINCKEIDSADSDPKIATSATDPAYILYTSGSNGQPKGVLLGHTASRYIETSIRHFHANELQQVAAVTSISFDPSVFEIFAPLACGGAILLKDHPLEAFTASERPTLMQGVPSVLRQLAQANAIPASVQVINCGGEMLTRDTANAIFAACVGCRIYNHYGLTEGSICSTISAVDRNSIHAPDVGKPVAGAKLHIRDFQTGEPISKGEPGEIYIGGPGLAMGYLTDPALTEKRFVIDPITHDRVYKTGDIGRINDVGHLEILGRGDDQVKLRGHRIELAEIDAAMIASNAISDAGTVVLPLAEWGSHLVGFISSSTSGAVRHSVKEAVRHTIRQRLPASMVPHRLEWLETIPRLPSGKIDRAKLLEEAKALTLPPGKPISDERTTDPSEMIGKVFGNALSRKPLGPDDDFFAMGGDSLMCIGLAMQLEEILGQPLSASLLAHHSTPREIVLELDRQKNRQSLITFDGNYQGEPIFFAPGISGSDRDYDSLCPKIAHRKLVKLHTLPLLEGLIAKPIMETLTASLVPLIEKEKPEGTLALLGYSVGGAVAYALAQELEKRGRETRLILVDPQISHCDATTAEWLTWVMNQLWPSIKQGGLQISLKRLLRSLKFWFPNSFGKFWRDYLPDFIEAEHRAYSVNLIKAEASLRYTPRSSSTLLITAGRVRATDHFQNPAGWSGWKHMLVGEDITKLQLTATHSELIRRPVVNSVASIVENWLSDRGDQSGRTI